MPRLNPPFRAALLGLFVAVLLPLGGVCAGVPGDATTPPLTVRAPNPRLPSGGQSTWVELGVWIRADGTVEDVQVVRGDAKWGIQAVEAVKRWLFQPVQWEGKGVAARTGVLFSVSRRKVVSTLIPLPNLPGERHAEGELWLTPPAQVYEPEVIVPLEGRLMRATPPVAVRYVVEDDGSTGRFEVLTARSEQALRAVLDMVSVQTYRPGSIRGESVAVELTRTIRIVGASEIIAGLEGASAVADPVYPYERLLAREAGRARVRFQLSAEGEVESVAVVEASHPDFGAALMAAVETWQFTTAAAQATPQREFEYDFALDRLPYGARRLADAVREGHEISNRGTGLDARPVVQARPALVYPRGLLASGVPGSAKVEFVIDRSGLAQLPRVVEASAPEFGWAAATWVNGMRFAPVSRSGQAAELRVLLPVQFTPPAAAGAPAPAPAH